MLREIILRKKLANWQSSCFFLVLVQFEQLKLGFQKLGKPALGGLLVLLLLAFSVLAASPDLHQRLHADSNSSNHNCIVSLFAKGQITPAAASLILIAFVSLAGAIALLAETQILPSADYRFSASRAPPPR